MANKQNRRIQKAESDFEDARTSANEAVEQAVRAFAEWCPAWMPEDTAEKWESANGEPYPGEDYMRGYEAALESIVDAAEFFFSERE